MGVNRRTLRFLKGMRIEIDATVNREVIELVRAWGAAWNEIQSEWTEAIDDLVAASKDNRWPSRAQIRRAERAKKALQVTREAIDDLAYDFNLRVLSEVQTLTGIASAWEAKLIGSQLPRSEGTDAELAVRFDRVDKEALEAIVERTTGRIESLTRPLSRQAVSAMQSSLIRGIAIGDNPRTAAARMLQRVEGDFNGGRNRALVIARTEMLDAYRASARAQDLANASMLRGWQWVARLDRRTCPSCWAMHGTTHDVTDPGPLDHQQGRCARLPRTKGWDELGFDVDEPADILPIARDVFDQMPRADQLAVLGPRKLAMLDAEQIGFEDLTKRRSTDGWRDSYVPTTMHDLIRKVNR